MKCINLNKHFLDYYRKRSLDVKLSIMIHEPMMSHTEIIKQHVKDLTLNMIIGLTLKLQCRLQLPQHQTYENGRLAIKQCLLTLVTWMNKPYFRPTFTTTELQCLYRTIKRAQPSRNPQFNGLWMVPLAKQLALAAEFQEKQYFGYEGRCR